MRLPLLGLLTVAVTAGLTADELIVVGYRSPGVWYRDPGAFSDGVGCGGNAVQLRLWVRMFGAAAAGSEGQQQ